MRLFGTRAVEYAPSLGLLAVSIAYLVTAWGYEGTAGEMPVAVGWIMIVLLLLDVISRTETSLGHKVLHVLNPAAEKKREDHPPFARQFSAVLWPVLFSGSLIVIGVLPSVLLYVFGFVRFHGKRSMLYSIAIALGVTAFTWFLFAIALSVDLYDGILFTDA